MLHHMGIWADENGFSLIAKDVPENLANALIKRDFIEKEKDFIRNPQ